MKKTFLTLGLFSAMTFAATAQDAATTSDFKPAAGNITVEVNATSPFAGSGAPFSLSNNLGFGSTPSLRLRYFLSDNLAFRIQFNIEAAKYKQDLGSKVDVSANQDGSAPITFTGNTTPTSFKVTSGRTLIAIAPGLELHKNVSERLSVYYGGYIDFAIQSASGKVTGTPASSSTSTTQTTGATSTTITRSGEYTYESKGQNLGDLSDLTAPTNTWGAAALSGNITSPTFGTSSANGIRQDNGDRGFLRYGLVGVLGADYYITKALYLGLEVGWGFNVTSFKKVTVTEKATSIITTTSSVPGGVSTDPATPVNISATRKTEENKDSQFNLNPVVNAAFRFGFWF